MLPLQQVHFTCICIICLILGSGVVYLFKGRHNDLVGVPCLPIVMKGHRIVVEGGLRQVCFAASSLVNLYTDKQISVLQG